MGGTCLVRRILTKAYCMPPRRLRPRESAKFGVNSTFNGIDMAQVGKYRDSRSLLASTCSFLQVPQG